MDATPYVMSDTWLKAEELKGRHVSLEIEQAELVTFGSDDPKEHKIGLFFKNRERGIVLNKTNTKKLVDTWGAETDEWIGKSITASPNNTPLGIGFSINPIEDDFNDEIPF